MAIDNVNAQSSSFFVHSLVHSLWSVIRLAGGSAAQRIRIINNSRYRSRRISSVYITNYRNETTAFWTGMEYNRSALWRGAERRAAGCRTGERRATTSVTLLTYRIPTRVCLLWSRSGRSNRRRCFIKCAICRSSTRRSLRARSIWATNYLQMGFCFNFSFSVALLLQFVLCLLHKTNQNVYSVRRLA